MPRRVFIGSIATETNVFSPLRTDLTDFKESFYAAPGQHPHTPTLCSAVYPVARARAAELNWQIIEGTATWAEPGGIVSQQTWEFLREQLLAELRDSMPVDIVLLGLHGAMVAQHCLDCEGVLIRAVREIVGSEALIGATFDPHSNLTAARVDNADVVTVFKEFPHTDFVIVAENLVELIHRTSIGEIKPRISTFDCRMIEMLPTNRQPMRGFVDEIMDLEGQSDVLSISVIHGFMASDVPELGTSMIVITDDNVGVGEKLAQQLGMKLFAMRGKTRPEFLTPAMALDRAEQATTAPVVIADVWDNPGGGVPGDSTIILKEMMRRRLSNAALASIWDPIAVRTCFSAGKESTLRLRFGSKMSDKGGEPIDADVIVRNIVPDAVQSFGQSIVPLGNAVWIEVNGVDVILNSVRSQVFNPDNFSNLGIDPNAKGILVVKSTNHFYAAFSQISSEIIYAEVNGPYPNNPVTNDYRNLKRAIWPRVVNPHEI